MLISPSSCPSMHPPEAKTTPTHSGQSLLTPRALALAGGLVLAAARLELVGDGLLADLLSLLLVDGLHQHTLVLEHVTLDLHFRFIAAFTNVAWPGIEDT